MRILMNTINEHLIPVKPVAFVPDTLLVLPHNDNPKYGIGEVLYGETRGQYVLYPKHSGYMVEDVRIIPKGDILAMVEPDKDEKVESLIEQKRTHDASMEWVNTVNTR